LLLGLFGCLGSLVLLDLLRRLSCRLLCSCSLLGLKILCLLVFRCELGSFLADNASRQLILLNLSLGLCQAEAQCLGAGCCLGGGRSRRQGQGFISGTVAQVNRQHALLSGGGSRNVAGRASCSSSGSNHICISRTGHGLFGRQVGSGKADRGLNCGLADCCDPGGQADSPRRCGLADLAVHGRASPRLDSR
jgi:hypothetical protein